MKHAWQMTRAELIVPGCPNAWRIPLDLTAAQEVNYNHMRMNAALVVLNVPRLPTGYKAGDVVEMYGWRGTALHKDIIQRAVEANEPVPLEVLEEYPDLMEFAKFTREVES